MALIENRNDHLFVVLSERYSLDSFLASIQEIAQACEAYRLEKALIDISMVEGNPSILDRYQLGLAMAETWAWRIKAAVVAKPSIINYVAETVAVNRGARFKVFSEMNEAKEWLLLDSPK